MWGWWTFVVNNGRIVPGAESKMFDETRWRAAWDLKVFGYINVTGSDIPPHEGAQKGCLFSTLAWEIFGSRIGAHGPSQLLCGPEESKGLVWRFLIFPRGTAWSVNQCMTALSGSLCATPSSLSRPQRHRRRASTNRPPSPPTEPRQSTNVSAKPPATAQIAMGISYLINRLSKMVRVLVGIPMALASCESAGCVLASPSI